MIRTALLHRHVEKHGASVSTSPDRVVFTGDFLRLNAAGTRPTQHQNIRWLRNILSTPIAMATGCNSSVFCWNSGAVRDGLLGDADINRFYGSFGLPRSIHSWARIHGIDTLPRRMESMLRDVFRGSLVVGFEMAPYLSTFLTREGIPFVNVSLHPVRFLDDLLLGFASNHPAIQEAIFGHRLDDASIRLIAGLQKASAARGFNASVAPDSALFLMQTWYDQSQLRDGRFVSPTDFLDEIISCAAEHEEFLVKEHPLEPHPAISTMAALIPNMRLVKDNVYSMLALPEIRTVATLSSSVGLEAEYFDKQSRFFLREPLKLRREAEDDRDGYVAIRDAFLMPDFWRKILAPVMPVSQPDGITVPFKPNRLRIAIRGFWGFNEIDTDIPVRMAK
ncbi:hypothetical protein [Palleronia sp. LCG004]|uniref:hypothetical protein n=1 Tax=Palleronia sp. LCG004 TaxID=3079304 RepID=UPI00294293E3|nr:hypothetical protein [Palleronia sp. LCG004]WOI58441.1 hypothetical protein RVY76_18330 [Palleronia sp. LCG004]